MFLGLFQSAYQKEAILLARNARKLLHKKKDTLSEGTVAELQTGIDKLEDAARRGDEPFEFSDATELRAPGQGIWPFRPASAGRRLAGKL